MFIGFTALSCSDRSTNPQQRVFLVQNMRLSSNEVPGWINKIGEIISGDSVTPPDSGWVLLPNPASLQNQIDGGYLEYANHGWLNGAEQKMEFGVPQYQTFVFNFGTADNATAMFKAKISDPNRDSLYLIPGFDKSVAFGTSVLGGGTIFAHKNNLYFEMNITGYDSSEVAFSTAALFLNNYFDKMK
jgi:hypothetical protein